MIPELITINALIGGLLPLAIALINQSHWPAKIRALMAIAVCVLAAVLAEVLRDGLTWAGWRNSVVVILTAALASYHLLWRPSTIAPDLERATSLGAPPTADTRTAYQ